MKNYLPSRRIVLNVLLSSMLANAVYSRGWTSDLSMGIVGLLIFEAIVLTQFASFKEVYKPLLFWLGTNICWVACIAGLSIQGVDGFTLAMYMITWRIFDAVIFIFVKDAISPNNISTKDQS